MPQLFKKISGDGIKFGIAKFVDVIFIVRREAAIDKFHADVKSRIRVGRFITSKRIVYNRLTILFDEEGLLVADMSEHMCNIQKIDIPRHRRKQPIIPCARQELTDFLALKGSLNYLCHRILPQEALAASNLPRLISNLTVTHLVTVNKMLDEIKEL